MTEDIFERSEEIKPEPGIASESELLSSTGVTYITYTDGDGSTVMEALPYGQEWIPADVEDLRYE